MTQHLLKLAVGVDDNDHLSRIQKERLQKEGVLRHFTRNAPRRREDVLDGGSLYWVIRGVIRARQRLVDIESGLRREDGAPLCAFVLDPKLVRTQPVSFRPFQGWRYLSEEKAPKDLDASMASAQDMPEEMARELRVLGLL
ncbi:DUF1489 family protein [Varunaivibrio sulfuroxidans]|uniref:DUF1489 family protein n=1 Tax=Varunaivibrio sulfuroxidans TaxID=1773489 RepID=A0A4R3J9B7_9PROT|nr:DUF1489 domain-containing protein [Varunaivibrio sulfuroxidans]TCS62097.1 hypothetical protein EDD55_10652 [Varunaivibrio sulfuroxidans]WES30530.1 DUF1489 domain-containing protein [Varunaivibrio sulfuroxidans]